MDPKRLIQPLMALIAFLYNHNGAVLVIVTAVYAFFTVLLWRATKRQAIISTQIFEASYRPWLSLSVQDTALGDGRNLANGLLAATIVVENRGRHEAQITDWSVALNLRDSKNQVRAVRAVNQSENLEHAPVSPKEKLFFPLIFSYEGSRDVGMSFTLDVIVFYRGIASWTYQTHASCQGVVGMESMNQRMYRGVMRQRGGGRFLRWINSRIRRSTGRRKKDAEST